MAFSTIAALVFFRLALHSAAHTLPVSFLRVVPDADYLHLELTFNPFELTFFSELDANKNGRVDPREWEAQQSNATRRILGCLKVRVGGKVVAAGVAGISPDFDSHHATLRAHYAADARRCSVTIESSLATLTSGSHFTQVTFGRDAGVQSARLDMQSTTATFESLEKNGSSAAPLPHSTSILHRSPTMYGGFKNRSSRREEALIGSKNQKVSLLTSAATDHTVLESPIPTIAPAGLLVLGILPPLGILLVWWWIFHRTNRLHPKAIAEIKPAPTAEIERIS